MQKFHSNHAFGDKKRSNRRSDKFMFHRGHSKMTPPRKCQILDPPPPMSPLITFFTTAPTPDVTRQIVTNFFLGQRP